MKNKYIMSSIAIAAMVATACDDYNDHFDGLQDGTISTDVSGAAYTLEGKDYAAIASNAANQKIAEALDAEKGGTAYTDALAAIGKNKCFGTTEEAELFVPAVVGPMFTTADNGKTIEVTYSVRGQQMSYEADFGTITDYALTDEDYASVWASKVQANYLSPTTVGKIAKILGEQMTEAQQGDMVVVNYAYSDVEPSIGGAPSSQPTWTEVSVPTWPVGSNWNYVNSGLINLSDYAGQTINIAMQYVGTESVAPTVEVRNVSVRTAQYFSVAAFAKTDDGYKLTTKISEGQYVLAALGSDGNYYPFGKMKDENKGYGYTDQGPITVTDGMIATADGDAQAISIATAKSGNNYSLRNALGKYVYQSGNYDSFNFAAEEGDEGYEWAIASNGNGTFDIRNTTTDKSVKLNYYKEAYTFGSYAQDKNVVVKYALTDPADNGGFEVIDVNLGSLTYVWSYDTQKGYGWKASSNFNKQNNAAEAWIVSPAIALAEGATAYLDFDCAINYLSGADRAEHVKLLISTDYSQMANKAAAVRANSAALYVFDGSAWKPYTNADCTVDVVSPEVYQQLGSQPITEPESILPHYLSIKYPYATDKDRFAVVYLGKDGYQMVSMTLNEVGTPAIEGAVKAEKLTIVKEEGQWITDLSTFYACTFLGGETGNFSPADVELGGLNTVWTCEASYGWKGTAYANSKNYAVDSYVVSPVINLSKAKNPVLNFEEAINYLNGADANTMLKVKATANYTGDPASTQWTELTLPVRASGSGWDYVAISGIDLSAFAGSQVVIAFEMKTDGSVSPTWEFKNLSVTKGE